MNRIELEGDLSIQHASDFHQAILPLVTEGKPVRLNACQSGHLHTSILQILYVLSREIPDFKVLEASEEFCLSETRVGFFFSRV